MSRGKAGAGEACRHCGGGGGGRGSRLHQRRWPCLAVASPVQRSRRDARGRETAARRRQSRGIVATMSFNHSPRPPLLAVPRCRSPWPSFSSALAPAVAAGKASERTKASAGGTAGLARLLTARCFLHIDRDGLGEQCERTNKGVGWCGEGFARLLAWSDVLCLDQQEL